MKKRILVSIVIGLVLGLTGCGSAQSPTASATAAIGLSMEGTLLVGTLKLESTSLAVSSTQASELLPLWETLQSMASSGTAASQEIDAVVSQIESSMSTEQVSSITAMNLTQQDLATATAETGAASAPAGSANTTNTSAAQPQGDAGAPGAGVPPAGMGGGMPASSGVQSAGQALASATQSVTGQTVGTSNQVSAALINTLVELLKKKIG